MLRFIQTLGLLLLFTALFLPAIAQVEKAAEQPYIEVSGIAQKVVTPDEIWISITLRERQENREKVTVAKQEEELLAALKQIGISQEQLSLAAANARYAKVGWSRRDVMAKTDYLLLVSTAEQVARVYEKLDELNISDAHISRVSHSKIEEFKKEVRVQAIKAAKAKADYLLNAIGEQTGKALVVKENNAAQNYADPQVANYIVQNSYSKERSNKGSIEFRKIKIDAELYVKFGIQ